MDYNTKNFLKEGLDPIEEPTYQDVLDSLDMILEKGLRWAVIENLEATADYILALEKFLDEKKLVFDEDELKRIKIDYEKELKEEKKWFLLHFAGKIIKTEGP